MRKALLWIAVIVVGIVVYNLDAITGQWKFDRLCERNGGARLVSPVEKDVGWEVEGHDRWAYQPPFRFTHVAFVRYTDESGARFDVRRDQTTPGGYKLSAVDESSPVRYRFRREQTTVDDDPRMLQTREEIVDVRSGQVVASYTHFGYQWTKPERVVLAAPTAVQCRLDQSELDEYRKHIFEGGRTK